MAKYNKLQVLETISTSGMIPLFYHSDIETVKNVVKACFLGGVKIFEFTNRGEFAHEVFGDLSKYVSEECPGLILGVGSIVDAPAASLYLQMGANFIVGPLFNPEVAKVANRRLAPYVPGCGTSSEIGYAQEAGCDLCKIFPGEILGPGFVKAIKGPMPWSLMMASGGVKPEEANLKAWFDAGVFCVGLGSNLFPKEVIDAKEWGTITELCKNALDIIKRVRKS